MKIRFGIWRDPEDTENTEQNSTQVKSTTQSERRKKGTNTRQGKAKSQTLVFGHAKMT